MLAVVKRLGEGEVAFDGHHEGDTAGAEAEEAPHDANEAEHPHVALGVALGLEMRLDCHLRQHSHQPHAVERHQEPFRTRNMLAKCRRVGSSQALTST